MMSGDASRSDRCIAGLQSPAAYPHPVSSLHVVETHISWVILTGEFAYKIKKPVALGFLDFSTLARRRRFCEEELRLNRRFSPDLYLDVVPITGSAETPQIGGHGDPIEFAVRMRQFPEDALFSRKLRANAVQPVHIDALARTIAVFHNSAAVAAVETPWGTPDAVWAPVAENFRQLQLCGVATSEVRQLQTWSRAEFDRLQPDFKQRRASGHVRECHGDLHANNLLILDDQVRMFDCVEFNENFRWVDVLSDLAFICMDLADFGRADFAYRLRNAYLEITGDYAGLAVWSYYMVYRAMVRAKVAAIRSRQSTAPADRSAADEDLRKYLTLAADVTRPTAPRLFITHGPSGSGKSTLTQSLLESLGAVRVRSDIERLRLTADVSAADRYSPQSRQRVYDRLAELAGELLRAGQSAIVDATFLLRSQREQFRRLAERLRVPFRILEFRTPREVLRDRVLARRRDRQDASEADIAVLDAQLESAEPLDDVERAAAILIDTTCADPLGPCLQLCR